MPKRFLHVMRSRENLSSGLKRAGCADLVGVPSGAIFCGAGEQAATMGRRAGTGEGQQQQWRLDSIIEHHAGLCPS